MHCTPVEYAYAATVGIFVAIAAVATWWHSSLIKMLEFRNASTFALLGEPHPLRTAESSRHAIGMLQFVLLGEHKVLNDEIVNTHVRVLQRCFVLSAITVVVLVAGVVVSASPESLLAFRCWRGQ